MSENRDDILSQIDNLKTVVSQTLEKTEHLENEAEELRTARREADMIAATNPQTTTRIAVKCCLALDQTDREKEGSEVSAGACSWMVFDSSGRTADGSMARDSISSVRRACSRIMGDL